MLKKFFLSLIKLYRKGISPYKGRGYCNYVPTCSMYAYEAIEKYGAFTGGIMALKRFLRCNPFCKGGYDPVPITLEKKRNIFKRR